MDGLPLPPAPPLLQEEGPDGDPVPLWRDCIMRIPFLDPRSPFNGLDASSGDMLDIKTMKRMDVLSKILLGGAMSGDYVRVETEKLVLER
ncbi:hypothetical protein ACLOJK_032314 [Asimina triloba]